MITEQDVGRRVVVNNGFLKNCTGVLLNVKTKKSPPIGVCFDIKRNIFHDCHGLCPDKFGYYVDKEDITFDDRERKGIRIDTEKFVDGYGNLCRKITGLEALPKEKLPRKYLDSSPSVYKNEKYLHINTDLGRGKGYFVSEVISENDFQKLLDYCRKAGTNLMEVNRELKRIKADWNGSETFTI